MKAKPHAGSGPRLDIPGAQGTILTHSSVAHSPGFSSETPSERSLHRRAVEAVIWGMPLVAFASMRHAYLRDAGAQHLDMVYWSNPDVSTKQTPAPHQTAVALIFASLRAAPLILEVPPLQRTVSVSVFDAWSELLPRAGAENENDAGARYLLVPPGAEMRPLEGCTPLRVSTFEVGCSVRITPETGKARELVRASVLAKKLRIRPLLMSASTPPSRFIDMTGSRFDGAPPRDATFFARLAEMVVQHPPRMRDAAMLGLLGTLGVRKGLRFQPTPEVSHVYESAVREAFACVSEERRSAAPRYWPTRRWRSAVRNGRVPAEEPRKDSADTEGAPDSSDVAAHEGGVLCLCAFEDARGEPLDGSRVYRLHLPAAVPTRRYWSVAAYDDETSAFIGGAQVVGASSRDPKLRMNPDGSADLYFTPRRPDGNLNWISTGEGRRFFVAFRNYAPDPYVLTHPSRWMMSDLEPMDRAASREKSASDPG